MNKDTYIYISFIICVIFAVLLTLGLCIEIYKYKKGNKNRIANMVLIIILLLASVAGIVYISIGRKATNRDIDVNFDQNIAMSMTFEITPEVDIDGLELKFEFKDKNRKIVTTKTKKLNDVKKGETYKIYIELNEFKPSQILDMYGVSTNVIGGRVSYL